MKEVKGNIWDFYYQGYWIGITTNGVIKNNGEAVMGKGLAKEAKKLFPDLPSELAEHLKRFGNTMAVFPNYNLICIPTKNDWKNTGDLELIEYSCEQLKELFEVNLTYLPNEFYIPRLGCGNGGLNWEDVKPIMEKYLNDRFIVVSLDKDDSDKT